MADLSRFFRRVNRQRPSGNGDSKHSHYYQPEPSTVPNTAASDSPSQMGVADTSLPWLKALWEFGRERGRIRASYRSHTETNDSLREYAVATANANAPLPWDPENNVHDAMLTAELKKFQSEEVEAVRKHDDDVLALEEMERERANNARDVPKPRLPIITIVLTTASIALSLAPSFYAGLFSSFDDERIGWLLASVLGMVGAGGVVSLIVGGNSHAD